MGRHRRSAAEPAAPTAAAHSGAGRHRGARRAAAPVRTGLLGVSAAMAVGAVAVTSGLLPGGGDYTLGGGGDSGGRVRADSVPQPRTQGVPSASPTGRAPSFPGRDAPRAAPSPGHSSGRAAAEPSAIPSQRQPSTGGSPQRAEPDARPSATKSATPDAPSQAPAATQTSKAGAAAEAEVLALVNDEREKAGCSPVTADGELAGLAQSFSEDMAERGFFSHTDPDGATPWDRAEKLGISGLGGENIARGQTSAQSVMDAWMASPGHRANILNCDYKTLGVGAHFADGGPWWTQDFGY